jgi:hypothetical protein
MADLTELVQSYHDMVKELALPDSKSTDSKSPKPNYISLRDQINEKGGSVNSKVVAAAHLLIDTGNTDGRFCWDFVFLCYFLATAIPNTIYQANFSAPSYKGHVAGPNHAPENLLSQIQPGAFLYINNQNTADEHGNHSVVVLNGNGKTAEVASLWQPHDIPKIHNVNFYDTKGFVTYIGLPVATTPDNPWFKTIDKR